MNWTKTGKILVYVNLAFSLVLAAWAFGIFSNRVDWAYDKSKAAPGREPSELTKRQDRLKQVGEARGFAELRMKDAFTNLAGLENQRRKNETWYAQELQKQEIGQAAVKGLGFQQGKFVLEGQNPYGVPVLVDLKAPGGAPLVPSAAYNAEYQRTQDEIRNVLTQIDTAVKEQARLTAAIDGTNGLRAQILKEDAKQTLIVQEQRDLQPLKVNALVEGQLLLKRQNQLEARVKELRTHAGVATREP